MVINRKEMQTRELKALTIVGQPRELCPTCQKSKDGTFEKQGIQCVLHFCPDYDKYYCLCDGTSPMTKEEQIKEWGQVVD